MENNGLGTHNRKFWAENSMEIPQIPYNLLDNLLRPSAQIGQLFRIFLRKVPITFPLSTAAIR